MKKIVILFVVIFTFSTVVVGQETLASKSRFELSSADFSAGESFLSGGFALSLGFKGVNSNTLIMLREDKILINHVYPVLKIRTALGPSFGYFQNVPFAGAIVNFKPHKLVSTMHWAGYLFGEPKAQVDINPRFLFLINKVDIHLDKFKVYYVALNFMKLPVKQVVGVCYEQRMTKNICAYTNIGYDLTNEKQLLQVGVIWRK